MLYQVRVRSVIRLLGLRIGTLDDELAAWSLYLVTCEEAQATSAARGRGAIVGVELTGGRRALEQTWYTGHPDGVHAARCHRDQDRAC